MFTYLFLPFTLGPAAANLSRPWGSTIVRRQRLCVGLGSKIPGALHKRLSYRVGRYSTFVPRLLGRHPCSVAIRKCRGCTSTSSRQHPARYVGRCR